LKTFDFCVPALHIPLCVSRGYTTSHFEQIGSQYDHVVGELKNIWS